MDDHAPQQGTALYRHDLGYRTPKESLERKKPWICARVEKSLTGRYFRHMFRDGRVIITARGWYERSLENGKKQPWYITRKANEPTLVAGLTNFRPDIQQTVEIGFVIVTEDSGVGMVDVHALESRMYCSTRIAGAQSGKAID